jgi:NADH dehydrogenase/LAGLIDADG endonuclease
MNSIFTSLISIIESLLVIVPALLSVAFVTIAERKTMSSMQRRLGPNIVGYYGLLQAFADALKLLLKEYISPTQANIVLFFLGPIITLTFSLLGYLVIPYDSSSYISDFSLGILYMLAVSSLSTYGILLAGWSANSKYAFLGSKWPNRNENFYILLSYFYKRILQTISEKFSDKKFNLSTLLGTLTKKRSNVKILLKVNNSQVTKALSSLVGTSEAIRLLSLIDKNQVRTYISTSHPKNPKGKSKKWNQWLAGLIDGDGSFYLTKKGYASLDITMDLRDEHALYIIKNVYGGSVKLVSGEKAVRYSLRHKEGFIALVNDVNGEIRNSYRLKELNKICLKYGVTIIYPNKLMYFNGWLSGVFDSDGSISINKSSGQISINITQKTKEMLEFIVDIFGGAIYIDRTSNNYKWYISNKDSVLKFIDYIKIYPCRSMKKNRLHLLPRIYELKDLSAYKATMEDKPMLAKSWAKIMTSWDKYEI